MRQKIHSSAAVAVCLLLALVSAVAAQPYAQKPVPTRAPRPVMAPFDEERFKGKTVMVLAYSIDNPRAGEAVRFLQEMYLIRGENNFEVLGLNINDNRTDEVLKFNHQHGALFPLLIDKNGETAKSLNLLGDLSLYLFSKQGELISSVAAASIPQQRDLRPALNVYFNRIIKLGFIPPDEPVLGDMPPAPVFEARIMDNSTITLKQLYKKKPVLLVFFSPMCSHCRDELAFLNSLLAGDEFKDRFTVVAVSRHTREVTAKYIAEQGFTFPVLVDADNSISALFPSFVGIVPMGYIIDRSGRIIAKHSGFSERMRDIYLMELRKLCGLPNKPLLEAKGYSGEERCQVCHEKQQMQWSVTGHPYALKSLQRKGKEDDPACVICHVTGWGKPGGYAIDDKKDTKAFEGVQCESCHGPGYEACTAFTGTKQKKKTADEWKAVCQSCHTEKESLNFNFARRYPKVLHGAMPALATMNRDERVKLLSEHKRKKDLFSNPAAYMGAESCKKCHVQEYAQWATTAHAEVAKSPEAAAAPQDKQYRYTTGSGSPGGYPAAGRQGVQCEACHGPGERHVKEPKKKGQDYIVGLGGSCDSCVVEQICRSCHGPTDDPKFKFDQSREAIRHKPKQ